MSDAAERAVISGLLSGYLTLNEALEVLPSDSSTPVFSGSLAQRVWEHVLGLASAGRAPSALAIKSLDPTLGLEYFDTASGSAFDALPIVRDSWAKRVVVDLASGVTRSPEPFNQISRMVSDLAGLLNANDKRGPLPASVVHSEAYSELERAVEAKHRGETLGLSTGFQEIDLATGGLQQGELVVIAGGTGKGKSILMLDFLMSAAASGKRVLLFSLEMPRGQYMQRVWARLARAPLSEIRKANLSPHALERIRKAGDWFKSGLIHIDDRGGLNAQQICAASSAHAAKTGGVDLVVVDYLQRIAATDGRDNEERQTTLKAKSLKTLARDLNAVSLTASQVNEKENKSVKGWKVRLQDMKSANGIAEESDLVIGIHENKGGDREIAILKQRQGPPVDYFPVQFDRQSVTFSPQWGK